MGSGEGGQGPVGGLEVGQSRAGGGTTYNWGGSTGRWVRWSGEQGIIVCAWEELRHLPSPSLCQWRKSPEKTWQTGFEQQSQCRAGGSQGSSCPHCTSREEWVVQDQGWGTPVLTSWSSLPCSGAGCGEPGWVGGTWERPGLGAGPAGRSFTLLAGTMPCWPCREQRHQPSSPPAPSLCSTRRTSPRRKDSSCGDSAVLSYSARASWAWWVRWEQGEGSSHTSSGHITPAQNTELPGFLKLNI